jgi:cell division protein FtsW (lipid II flippase)
MKNKILHWAPRTLSVLFVGFLCLFSFDSFAEFNGWQSILAVVIHLAIPAVVLLGAIIAWKKDLVGAVIFFFFAVYYVYMAGLDRHWSWYASISGPAFFIGILYLLNWFQKRNKK